jgi:hypothetical protein
MKVATLFLRPCIGGPMQGRNRREEFPGVRVSWTSKYLGDRPALDDFAAVRRGSRLPEGF